MNGIPVEGFMYPNEIELQWSVLIVLYPFLTGLVAGAFILASLERVFRVEAVKPTYRLALLTALAFLLVAPLPLQLHLGHPERSLEMYLPPHTWSAMAMFGFVYLWYLIWLSSCLKSGSTIGTTSSCSRRRPRDGSVGSTRR
jgi:Ni/Fe-hydrogenase subunit HybB-like protein